MITSFCLVLVSMAGGDYCLNFELYQGADGGATLLSLFASQSVRLLCSVYLAQCLFEK